MEFIATEQIIKFIASLTFVLGLMGGLAFLVKKYGTNHPMTPNNKKRLKIIEILSVDPRRKLLLIQRDDKEHLIMLGQNTETVIESGIESDHNDTQNKPDKQQEK